MPEPYRRFEPEQLSRFLAALDRHLDGPARVCIIGGSAAALGYGVDLTTNDIDTFESESNHDRLASAAARATAETGLAITISPVAIADLPWNYEERLQRVLPGLRSLHVLVPERHDLVLSKIMRWQENDRVHISAIHAGHPLDLDVLVDRYTLEMGAANKALRAMDLDLVACVDMLFGEISAERVQERLRQYRAAAR